MARVYSILNPLQLQDRIVDAVDQISFSRIDYFKTNSLLEGMRKDSKAFLTGQVNQGKNNG